MRPNYEGRCTTKRQGQVKREAVKPNLDLSNKGSLSDTKEMA